MPLIPGKGHVSENISEFHKGPTFAHTEAKFGKERADKQAVAVALHTADKSKDAGHEEHQAAISKMNPAKLHQHMMDAAAGKHGPAAQQSAQQVMQPTPQTGEPDADDMAPAAPPARRSPFSGDNDADDQAPVQAPARSMFSGGR